VRKRSRERHLAALQSDTGGQRARLVEQRCLLRQRHPETHARSAPRQNRERKVVFNAEAAKDTGNLVRPRKTKPYALRHAERSDVVAREYDTTRVRAQRAGELVDERRLSSAVGADQRVNLPVSERKVHVIGGHQTAEVFVETRGPQHILSHRTTSGG
jgi:hypothetical protein